MSISQFIYLQPEILTLIITQPSDQILAVFAIPSVSHNILHLLFSLTINNNGAGHSVVTLVLVQKRNIEHWVDSYYTG